MPIDYKEYPPNWKTEIRPAVLKRADNRSEFCGLPDKLIISRDKKRGLVKDLWNGPVWEYDESGKLVKSNFSWHLRDWQSDHIAKVVLTIAHLDHDKLNHDVSLDRLRALCQRCHLLLDKNIHAANRKYGRKHKTNNYRLDF